MYQIFKYSFAKHTYKDYMQHHKMSIFTAKFLFNFTFPTVLTILYNSYLKDSTLQDNGLPDPGTFPDHSVLANTDIRTKLQHRGVRLLSILKYTAKKNSNQIYMYQGISKNRQISKKINSKNNKLRVDMCNEDT